MERAEFLAIIDYLDRNWDKPWEVEDEMLKLLNEFRKPRLIELGRTPLPTEYGPITYIVFGDYATGKEHDVAVFGKFEGKRLKAYNYPLVRVHSSCRTSELFRADNFECRQELDFALKQMSKEKKGILIYLNQEGGGNGIKAKLTAYKNTFDLKRGILVVKRDKNGKELNVYDGYEKAGYQSEHRDFDVAAAILKTLGVNAVRLMTNNPNKIEGLASKGIKVKPIGVHIKPTNEIMKKHLRMKAKKLGHNITENDLR